MTIFRLNFAGEIKKADMKNVGGKALAELSVCKKNRTKEGEPDSYTWLRICLWEPAEFQRPKLVKGSFIAGSGELTLRSYEGKDGKQTSMECRCSSFDVEVSDGSAKNARTDEPQQGKPQKPRIPAPSNDYGGCPF